VQIKELEAEAIITVRKLKYLESETAIRYMESDLISIEQKIKQFKTERDKKAAQEPVDEPSHGQGLMFSRKPE